MEMNELREILKDHAAYLRGDGGKRANLTGANLTGANLVGGKIVALVARVTRIIDPYEFFAWRTNKGDMIAAGCRFFSVANYRAHVAREYPGTPKAAETLRILDFFEASFGATP